MAGALAEEQDLNGGAGGNAAGAAEINEDRTGRGRPSPALALSCHEGMHRAEAKTTDRSGQLRSEAVEDVDADVRTARSGKSGGGVETDRESS